MTHKYIVDDAETFTPLFLSWEGDATYTLNGVTYHSIDIGVEETNSGSSTKSLQLTGTGSHYSEFSWTGPVDYSQGLLNAGQVISGSVCGCVGGYGGAQCLADFDECASSPCQNGATCTTPTFDSRLCTCVSGYTGTLCDINIDECDPNPCANNEFCEDGVNNYVCLLYPQCQNGATTNVANVWPIWINEVHYDDTNTDSNEGFEIFGPAGTDLSPFKVLILSGTSTANAQGEFVATPTGDPLEDLTGLTLPDDGTGYGGVFVPHTGVVNAAHSGLMLVDDAETFTPLFLSWEGDATYTLNGVTYHSIDIGVEETNSGSSTKSLQLTGTGSHYSEFSWTGPVDYSQGLLNAGQVISGSVCSCVPGTLGAQCLIDFDECASSPCQNGANCTQPNVNMFACDCVLGWAGDQCQTNDTFCLSSPCQNGGSCTTLVETGSFTCDCLPQYTGTACEELLGDPGVTYCRVDMYCHGGSLLLELVDETGAALATGNSATHYFVSYKENMIATGATLVHTKLGALIPSWGGITASAGVLVSASGGSPTPLVTTMVIQNILETSCEPRDSAGQPLAVGDVVSAGGVDCTILLNRLTMIEVDGPLVEPCSSSPCQNGGTCSTVGVVAVCSCVFPHFGEVCGESDYFVSRWNTALGTPTNEVKLPFSSTGTYNCFVQWGDGTSDTITSADQAEATHTYASPGEYTIFINGTIVGFDTGTSNVVIDPGNVNAVKLTEIIAWGPFVLGSNSNHFAYARNLVISDTTSPDLSQTTDMGSMFIRVANFNGDLSQWDVSSVTSMEATFYNAVLFNSDISLWNVSSVTNMRQMFTNTHNFNSDISQWDVSSVVSMYEMFTNALVFNHDLDLWDVSSVTIMDEMFQGAKQFNGNISTWDVSSVQSMASMFCGTAAFSSDLSQWDVSSVTNMNSMFSFSVFNSDLSQWDVSSVTNINSMFSSSLFNSDLSDWDVGKVTSMVFTFGLASVFNGNISNWDVSSVKDMSRMFSSASAFNGDISRWDVSSVTLMKHMFARAVAFAGDLSQWDVSSVTSMAGMFSRAFSFDSDLSQWDVRNVNDMGSMFTSAPAFNSDLDQWDVSSVTTTSFMFHLATSFNGNISAWDTSSVVSMDGMFQTAVSFNGDISQWNVSAVTTMQFMFSSASFFNADISQWDVSKVTNMAGMFRNASHFNQDLSGWCVSQISSEQSSFSTNTPSWTLPKPNWGAPC